MSPRRLLIHLLSITALAVSAGAGAIELPAPASSVEMPAPPRILDDQARPVDAPTHLAIQAAIDEGSPANAVTLAGQALAASRIAYGPTDLRIVTPLINQAHAKQQAGDVAGALADYRVAIELDENQGGPREPKLFDAWYGIGHTHQLAGQFSIASEALGTALQLHRVNQGLYSAGQLEVINALALAYRGQDKAEEADELQLKRVEVAERIYGLGTPELVPTYLSAARWYRAGGRISDAVALQGLAVSILEKAYSRDDPRLVDPLLEVVLTASLRRPNPDERPLPNYAHPATSLTRARRIAEAQKTGTPVEQARTLIRIADVNFATGRRDVAYELYTKAEALLASVREPSPLAQPAFISFQPPVATAPAGAGTGFVLAEFSVDAQGRSRDVRIVESTPAGLPAGVGSRLTSALREARLRPRIDKGKPAATSGVRYRLPVREGSA
ncbi:MAG: tetratricopeptide repeat protein [Panacagrimonas sp.]